jgi:hypothetical protein
MKRVPELDDKTISAVEHNNAHTHDTVECGGIDYASHNFM